MDNVNLISYFPTYSILDSIISTKNFKEINLYIDLRNIFRSLYIEHFVVNLIESTKISRKTDSSIFTSFLNFLIFHKKYAIRRNLKINFFVFFDMGQSYYHLNISKSYKQNRRIDDLFGLDKESREIFTDVMQKNLVLIEKVFNKIPNVKVINLRHLEADFIPYYLIRNSLTSNSSGICHIIYSNDHDLYQTLILGENVFQFLKTQKKLVLRRDTFLSHYLKYKTDIPCEYFPLIMSILGDKGDFIIDKVKGIGPKSIQDIIDNVAKLIGGMDVLYEKVMKNIPIFEDGIENEITDKKMWSIIESERTENIISKNLKLTSFEILSRCLDDPSNTTLLEKREEIKKVLSDNDETSSSSIEQALNRIGIALEESINILYPKMDMNELEI